MAKSKNPVRVSRRHTYALEETHARTNKSQTSTTTQHNNGAYPYVQTCGYLLQQSVCCLSPEAQA